ncbi:MAG TPA: hypothetical protein PKA68_04395 [Arachnia sp.]|nr:hypothetical protein [Arachnia sp.]
MVADPGLGAGRSHRSGVSHPLRESRHQGEISESLRQDEGEHGGLLGSGRGGGRRGDLDRHPTRGLVGTAVRRRVLAGTLAVGVALLSALPGAAVADDDTELDPAARFRACAAGAGAADVVLLFDESQSLRTSDPEAGRVVAATFLLDRLARMGERNKAEINVLVAGFGTSFRAYDGHWHALGSELEQAHQKVGQFETRNADTGTDYWLGLEGARRTLADRAREGGSACQAIVFFSDGELDVSLSPEEVAGGVGANPRRPFAADNPMKTKEDQRKASEAAAASLCRPGGLADQIRAGGIVTFGVGLSPDGAAGDFELMRSVVTGGDPGKACGDVLEPVPGVFALTTGVDEMVFAFDAVDSSGDNTETPICQGDACEAGRHPFVLDRTVSRVEILGSAHADDLEVALTLPSGVTVILPGQGAAPELAIPGVNGRLEWLTPKTFTLTLDSTSNDAWIGVWSLTFTDKKAASEGRTARTSIQVTGDLRPVLRATELPARVGERYQAFVDLISADGTVVDPAKIIADGSVAVTLLDPSGASEVLEPREVQSLNDPFVLSFASNGRHTVRIALDLALSAMPASGGEVVKTALERQVIDVPLPVLPPHGYPTIAGSVDFGKSEGDRLDAEASLAVSGPGCVWLAEDSYQVTTFPEGVGGVELTTPHDRRESCLEVPEGTEGALPLRLTSDAAGNGAILGEMQLTMAPLTGGDPRGAGASFSAELEKRLDPVNFAAMLIVAIVFGGGLPLAIAYLVKFVGATKMPSAPLIASVMDITVVDGLVRRQGRPLAFDDADLGKLHTSHAATPRRLDVDGALLRSTLGLSPFGAGEVKVSMPDYRAVSSTGSGPLGKDGHARIPLAVHDHWVVFASLEGDLKLLTLIASTALKEDRDAVLGDAAATIPGIIEKLGITPAGDAPLNSSWETSGDPPASDWDPFA